MACSSHCGEKTHLEILEKWIKKINLNINKLLCCIHNPINNQSSINLFLSGNLPTQLHNNCYAKILDKNNAAYIDGFFTFLTSKLFCNGLNMTHSSFK